MNGFDPSPTFLGSRTGYVFKRDKDGVGYYVDTQAGPSISWHPAATSSPSKSRACLLLSIANYRRVARRGHICRRRSPNLRTAPRHGVRLSAGNTAVAGAGWLWGARAGVLCHQIARVCAKLASDVAETGPWEAREQLTEVCNHDHHRSQQEPACDRGRLKATQRPQDRAGHGALKSSSAAVSRPRRLDEAPQWRLTPAPVVTVSVAQTSARDPGGPAWHEAGRAKMPRPMLSGHEGEVKRAIHMHHSHPTKDLPNKP